MSDNLRPGMNAEDVFKLRESLLKTDCCAMAVEVWLKSWKKSTDSALPQITLNPAEDNDLANIETATVRKGKKTGQRYMMFLIEINDDEQPVAQEPEKLKGGPLSIEAAGMCKNLRFMMYANSQRIGGIRFDQNEKGATSFLRAYCNVTSRAELDHNDDAAYKFNLMKETFQRWR